MLVLILPLTLLLLFLVTLQHGLDWRQAIIASALVGGAWLAVATELLSLFHLLNSLATTLAWLGLAVGVAIFYRQRKGLALSLVRPQLRWEAWLLLLGVGLIALGTGATAMLSPPNTWDSMTYHMSRVMHWIQNASVTFYPTYVPRQLYQPPFAEWAISHLQLLSGGDTLANLVQWFSWLGSLIAVSLIARELGAKQRGQIFCVVVAATINMGILQSSSTQNDLVVAFWILCTAYITLYGTRNGFKGITVVGLGAAIGLSVLTKGTTYVYIAPFILWTLIFAWQKQRHDILKYGLVLVLISLVLNIGQYSRNLRWFGSPLGGETELYSNQAMSPALWFSVVVRNLALHVAVQPDLDAKIGLSDWVNETMVSIHNRLGLSVDDPRVTIEPQHFQASYLMFHEDQTAAPAQLMLAVLAFILFIVWIRSSRLARVGFYGLAVVLAFALFCLTLRWQPWNNRLHTPWFMLLAPFIAVVLERYLHQYIVLGIAVYLLYIAVFPTVLNQSRPLIGIASVWRSDRWDVMFNNRPDLKESYSTAIDQIQQVDCHAVGLKLGLDTWEYPLWAKAAQAHDALRFTSVHSTLKMLPEFDTCAVIVSHDMPSLFETVLEVGQQNYTLRWNDDHLAVYQLSH